MCPPTGIYGVGSLRLRDSLSLFGSSLRSSLSLHLAWSCKVYLIFPELHTQTQRLICLPLSESSEEVALDPFKAS